MKKLQVLILMVISCLSSYPQQVSTLLGPDTWINDGIVFDDEGNLYGTDHAGFGVYKYTVSGELITLTTFENHPNGIVLDDENNLYVAIPQGNKIFLIDALGSVSQYGPEIPNPNGLIFEYDSDTLIVTSYSNNTLSKLAPDGTLNVWVDSDDLDGPLGLCYDNENVLYVSNFNDGNMFRVIGDDLEYFATVPGDYLGGPYFSTGYIMWHDGYVYATGFAKNIIYRIDENGALEEYAGSGIYGCLDGEASEARFMNPNGIAMKNGSSDIYVSGYGSHAVRVISENAQGLETLKNEPVVLNIYPNPVKSELYYEVDKNYSVDVIEIFGMNGLKIRRLITGKERHLDVTNLENGSYLIAVQCNQKVSVKPFIKK